MNTVEHRRLILPSAGTRRSLFGPVDHEESRMFLQKQMRLLDQECCQRWNFDFQKDSPLPGRYEWTPADCGDVSSDPPARQCDAAVQTCDESGTDAAADTDADTGCQLRNEMCPAPSRHPQQPAAAVITVAVQCGQAVEPEDKETTCTPTATAADPAKGCGSKRKRIITDFFPSRKSRRTSQESSQKNDGTAEF